MCIYYTLTTMMILTAGSGCAKLIFLPMRFCAPYPVNFAHHFYLHFTIIYACYDALMPIKLFDYSYYSINFLPPQTYLLMLQTPNSKITNYWYKTYELLIATKLTNYWYKTYELLILNLQTTNPFCYKLQILNYKLPILFDTNSRF